jgi:hypothetical protein
MATGLKESKSQPFSAGNFATITTRAKACQRLSG